MKTKIVYEFEEGDIVAFYGYNRVMVRTDLDNFWHVTNFPDNDVDDNTVGILIENGTAFYMGNRKRRNGLKHHTS